MRFGRAAAAAALIAGVAACSSGDDTSTARTTPPTAAPTTVAAAPSTSVSAPSTSTASTAGGTWTVLQYQMADTNLEPFMISDINEMGQVGSTDRLNIVALVDRSPDYGEEPALDLGDWVGAREILVGHGTGEVLDDLGEVDMADPATLSAFIADGIARFPADHYVLVMNDHGASWPGIGADESAGDTTMSLASIAEGVRTGLAAAGVARFDLLGFDACLMATYELASTMAPLADRMLASAELEPGHGWDYTSLAVLAGDPGATADDLGGAFLDSYLAPDDADATLALLDLTQMPALDAAMDGFTTALAQRAAVVAPKVGRTLAQNAGYGKSPDPTQDTFMTDLGTLATTIGVEALDLSDQADDVARSIGDVVVRKVSGPVAPDFTGLSIYFPPTADNFDDGYRQVPANGGEWLAFLDAYYGAGVALGEAAAPTFVVDEPVITEDADGLVAEAGLDPATAGNVTGAVIGYAVSEADGSLTYLGEEQADVADDGTVAGFTDLTVLHLSDGADEAVAYISLTEDDGGGFSMDVPMAYQADGSDELEDVLLTVTVDANGHVTSETYYVFDEASGTYGELSADPAGHIYPQVPTFDADGNEAWAPTTDVGLVADLPAIQYDFRRLPAGTDLFVELRADDYAGNSAFVGTTVTLS